jgi:LysM repeat protein
VFPQLKLIKDYNLEQYTLIAMGKLKPSDEVVLTMPGVPQVAAITPMGQGGTDGVAGLGAGGSVVAAEALDTTEVADIAYPQGEFTINRTRVVYGRAGASLLAIAAQYDVPLPRLLEFNDMQEEDVLAKGQLIFLQRKRRTGSTGYHVVKKGESLYDISQAEGIRYQDLLEMNQLTPGVQPVTGERIYLQGSAPSRPRLVDNKR